MSRFLIGLIVGAAGCGAVIAMNLNLYSLATPLVGLGGGLLIGALVGWRNPRPGRALAAGMGAGFLAGLLMLGGQMYGVSLILRSLRLAAPLRDVIPGADLFWWLAGTTGAICLLLAIGAGGAFAGILSAWTGLRPDAHPGSQIDSRPSVRIPALDDTMSLLPGPSER